MAWRPDQSLIRGEIDNTRRGCVRGTLWFLGLAEPVQLQLTGDAAPDLAGCRLYFTNPNPQPERFPLTNFSFLQSGQAGDITCANKRKDFEASEEEIDPALRERRFHELPFTIKNSLYLEWYSSTNGRVVIETCKYQLSISEPAWTTDPDEQAAQQLLSMAAMRDYLDALVDRSQPEDAKMPDEMNEDDWEAALKESDRLADAAMEAVEKFEGDPNAEAKEDFVMGWDHLPRQGPDPAEQADDQAEPYPFSEDGNSPDQAEADYGEEAYDWDRETPPLCLSARELTLQTMAFLKAARLSGTRESSTPADRLLIPVLQTNGKLGGALSRCGQDDPGQPTGYILAITRRCLNWLNEALTAIQEIHPTLQDEAIRNQAHSLTSNILSLRSAISDLRQDLTNGLPPGNSSNSV